MKNFLNGKVCLILVTIQKVQSFLMRLIRNLDIVDEFVGLKSKMYFVKKIDAKESNTGKRTNIATEFSEFKYVLFDKKNIRHKMKRIQVKKHKIGAYEIDKIPLSCFDDKRRVLDDGIYTLAYFHKNCDIEKYCDNGSIL